uniref:Uncharacterized protein n=1 Tax=Romanomermis culicivorax TaxID=13658 RepID=A0A915ILA2_ROMCU
MRKNSFYKYIQIKKRQRFCFTNFSLNESRTCLSVCFDDEFSRDAFSLSTRSLSTASVGRSTVRPSLTHFGVSSSTTGTDQQTTNFELIRFLKHSTANVFLQKFGS